MLKSILSWTLMTVILLKISVMSSRDLQIRYMKKYQEGEELRRIMQNEEFFKQLSPGFIKTLAEYGHNEIESDATRSYRFTDCHPEYKDTEDEVVFHDYRNGHSHTASKQILANGSKYFFMRFFGPHSVRDDKYVIFDDGIPENFEMFLDNLYHPTIPITTKNIDLLLPLAQRFSAHTMWLRIEEFLICSGNYSLAEKLTYLCDYDFDFVQDACLKEVECLDDLERLKLDEKFCLLPDDFKKRGIKLIEQTIKMFA
ncbi:unnamed protein product [Caenorhabditis brenneri]